MGKNKKAKRSTSQAAGDDGTSKKLDADGVEKEKEPTATADLPETDHGDPDEEGAGRGDEQEAEEEEDGGEKSKRRRKRKRKKKSEDGGTDVNDNDNKEQAKTGSTTTTTTTEEDLRASQIDRTVFVEGIPYTCTEEDVRRFFVDHGCEGIEECRLPVWHDSNRLRGYGHVVFQSTQDHVKALQLTGKYLQNRFLNIQMAQPPKLFSCTTKIGDDDNASQKQEPSKTIILQNLSYDATEDDIFAALEKFGTIVKGGVRVVRHSQTNRSKGFAYVEFQDEKSAMAVVQYTTTTPSSTASSAPPPLLLIRNRPCRVDYDHGRVKGSFRTPTGRLWTSEYGSGGGGGRKQNNATSEGGRNKR